jgi:hypothetical protein
MPGFIPRPFHVRFVVDKLALAQVFSEYFGFPLSVLFSQWSILISPACYPEQKAKWAKPRNFPNKSVLSEIYQN